MLCKAAYAPPPVRSPRHDILLLANLSLINVKSSLYSVFIISYDI